MNCNIIMDLLPLYADDCCSEESKTLVENHISTCKKCKSMLSAMQSPDYEEVSSVVSIAKFSRINQFKASIIQSALLFLSFAAITLGVTLEAASPMGVDNGNWAFMIIIPATAFMLSLANWYFIRFYKSRKMFYVCSTFLTVGLAVCGFVWASLHFGDFNSHALSFAIGVGISLVLCILSMILSSVYAKFLGKD